MKTTVMTNKETLRRTSAMAAAVMMVAVSANAIVVSANKAAEPQLSIDTITAEAGQSVDVNVMVDGNFDFTYLGTKLVYDSALNYTGCDIGESTMNKVGGTISVEENLSEGDVISMLGYTSATKPANNGILATLHFDVPRAAEPGTVYNISWYDIDEFGNVDTEYTPSIIDGSITVVADYELDYKVKNGEATVIGCKGDPAKVKIPEFHKGYPVTAISKDAFAGCGHLESVEIPDEVESIEDGAFGSDVDVKGGAGSAAESYAERNKFTFVAQGENAADGVRIDVDEYKFEFTDSVSFTKDNIHVVTVNENGKEVPVENWHFGTTPQQAREVGSGKVKVSIETENGILGYVTIDTGVKGNVSDSGKISARDAAEIFSAYKKAYKGEPLGLTARQEKLADYDGNGVITSRDAAAVFKAYKESYRM